MTDETEATFLAGEDERTQADRLAAMLRVDPSDHHRYAAYQQLGLLAVAVGRHDDREPEDALGVSTLEAVLNAARETLRAAGVPTGPRCSCGHTIYQHDAGTRCAAVEPGPTLCRCDGYDGPDFLNPTDADSLPPGVDPF